MERKVFKICKLNAWQMTLADNVEILIDFPQKVSVFNYLFKTIVTIDAKKRSTILNILMWSKHEHHLNNVWVITSFFKFLFKKIIFLFNFV
jgi:hypothetical protein